jgi:hypothetical protein
MMPEVPGLRYPVVAPLDMPRRALGQLSPARAGSLVSSQRVYKELQERPVPKD